MTKTNKILLLAVALCLLIALCIGVVSCSGSGRQQSPDPTGTSAPPAGTVGTEKMTYTLVLKSEGGMPIADVGVYFYTDSTKTELVWFAKTDAEGKVSFTDLASDNYVAVLDKVPDGYKVEEYYSLTGEITEIILSADMSEGDLANITYKLGDVMLNFSVTAPDGTVYVLSELLAEKEAVVLNFWYLQCNPCRAEFPYLQEAYEKYSEKIAVLALNPINDDEEAIAAFQKELGLTFPMAHCDPLWEKAMQLTAYPTTVIIDRYGTIALIHKGSVTESKVFEDAFEFFTADDYEQTTVENIEDLEIQEAGSDSTNPIEIGGKTSFTVTVKPGQLVYYHLYRLDGMVLRFSNEYAYAIYNNYTYKPSGGTVSYTVHCQDTFTPAEMAFGNSGTETQTFTVTLTAPQGTYNNPYTLKLGEFTTKVSAGNDQGVYYMYTATEDGRLTVQCTSVTSGVRYDYTLLNENTMAMRTIQQDGDASTGTVSISVKKGQKVRLTIGTLPDDSNKYPAATFKSVASIGEDTGDDGAAAKKIDYAITVTDENRKPIAGVVLNLKSVETEAAAEGSSGTTSKAVNVDISTNDKGVATTKQPAGTYNVTLLLKVGYTAATTEFQVTEDTPFVSIKMDTYVKETKTYTVTVTDAEGNLLSDVLVTIGSSFVSTDETGRAVFTLPKAAYTVYVTAPTGYMSNSDGYAFAGEDTELTVVLEQGSSEEDPEEPVAKKDYTVTVVDYSGNAQSGVVVQILKRGVPVATQQTGSDGKVTASLESADYTVSLAFSGSDLYYEPKKAVLPAGTTSLTIKVATGVSGEYESIYGMYTAYFLDVGGTYAEMLQSDVTSYFIFEPKVEGVYRFTTSDPEARIGYWGGSVFYISDMTSSTDYDPAANSFTRNIKKGNLGGVVVIGITGDLDCIVEITRISDPILDETDIVADVYEALTPPISFKIPAADGRKLQYVDLTGKTSDYQIVMGSDGYYHLNAATGPLLYMNLGPDARHLSMYNMLGYTGFGGTSLAASFYDGNGSVVSREDYTECMCAYVECIDSYVEGTQGNDYGVYPLTEDLVYMIQNGGGYKGWWNLDSPNYAFLDNAGNKRTDINLEIAWMFAVCYVP